MPNETMEFTWPLFGWSVISLAATLLLLSVIRRNTITITTTTGQLPPGPRGWPLLGNMFDLGTMPHRSLLTLQKYGPLIWLRLGSINTLVVSSPQVAMDLFKNHDYIFSGRTVNEALKVCNFYQGSISFGQPGPYLRMLRRLCATELFSHKRITETAPLRRKCVDNMIEWISNEANETGSVEVARFVFMTSFNLIGNLFMTSFNLIGNLMLSRDLVDPKSTKGDEFFRLTSQLVNLAGKANVADFFPWLRWLDPQGVRKKMDRQMRRTLDIAAGYVKERVQGRQNKEKDLLDVLLEFEGNGKEDEPNKISDENLNILIFELFIAATETTNSTIEWAMAELLCNPAVMNKVRAELVEVVGPNRKVEESDINDLKYLQAVVKETLRLHPPTPLLVPRRSIEDTKLMGYSIPKETQVFVNVWAFGRDPVTWENPSSFIPERFLGNNLDYRGQHFEFIPFGAGRRMCPGLPLAHEMLHLVLGSLLHCSEWVLEEGVTPETMDMTERMGTTLRKAVALKAIPRTLIL